jgi:hypothetical protein
MDGGSCFMDRTFKITNMVFVRRKDLSRRELLQQELEARRDGWITKKYKDKVVFAKRPEKLTRRSIKRKLTARQKAHQDLMKEAVSFARGIIHNPTYKAAWKKHTKGYTNVYQAALAWYLKNGNDHKVKPPHLSKMASAR